jgi:hypothetical protein
LRKAGLLILKDLLTLISDLLWGWSTCLQGSGFDLQHHKKKKKTGAGDYACNPSYFGRLRLGESWFKANWGKLFTRPHLQNNQSKMN